MGLMETSVITVLLVVTSRPMEAVAAQLVILEVPEAQAVAAAALHLSDYLTRGLILAALVVTRS